jgi:hypothetical protein
MVVEVAAKVTEGEEARCSEAGRRTGVDMHRPCKPRGRSLKLNDRSRNINANRPLNARSLNINVLSLRLNGCSLNRDSIPVGRWDGVRKEQKAGSSNACCHNRNNGVLKCPGRNEGPIIA